MTHAISPNRSLDTAAKSSFVPGEQRLRLVLRANAASSSISGVALAIAPAAIDEVLGTGQPDMVRLVGISLLPFAAFVAWLSTRSVADLQRFTPWIVAGDLSWVIASVVTSLLGWYSGVGTGVVIAVAVLIDLFATL